jgi:hypothetical protein
VVARRGGQDVAGFEQECRGNEFGRLTVLPRSSEKGTSCVEGCVETRAAVSGEASSGSEKRREEARRDETRRNETRVGRADGKREAKLSHSQSRPGRTFRTAPSPWAVEGPS